MRMRQSETFAVITDEITQDLTTVNDALMQSPKRKPRNDQDQQRWRNPKGYPGKGKNNKGKGKGGGQNVAMATTTTMHDNMAVTYVPTATAHDDGSLTEPADHDRSTLGTATNGAVEHTASDPDTAIVYDNHTNKGQGRQGRKRSQGQGKRQEPTLGTARPRESPWSRPHTTIHNPSRPSRPGDGVKRGTPRHRPCHRPHTPAVLSSPQLL